MAALSREKENRVFEVIDRVLKQVFGKEATRLMYQDLERRFCWSQVDFSERIDTFAKCMEEFLSSGAYVIEGKILDNIAGCEADCKVEMASFEDWDFASKIRTAIQGA
ncbi:MAG: hypothetical protein NWE94_07475 [Candidatus Bathyarchaeota archaeon]|nr:hypothetical protein [Candidatus Bathyarchaeota archaeon]